MAPRSFQPLSRGSSDKAVEVDTDGLPDLVEIDLDGKDADAFKVVVEDDTPEADRGRPTEVARPTEVSETELRTYSESAAKRIKRIDFERNTERRGREQAERTAEAAINDAREARAEVERLKGREGQAATAVGSAMLQRHESSLLNAQAELIKAIEDGDAAAQAAAQVKISTLAAEITTIKQRLPRPAPVTDSQQQQPQQVQQQQPQTVVADPAQNPKLHPQVREWIGHNNSWFDKPEYQQRTNAALNIDQQLKTEGIAAGTPEYIKALDERMAVYYPDHQPFKLPAQREPRRDAETDRGGSDRQTRSGRPNAGTEVTRENASSDIQANADPRTVRLTSSEVAVAKRLGVPLQRYAKEKVEREARKGGAQ